MRIMTECPTLRRLTPLLSSVSSRTARDALTEVVSGLAQNARLRKQAVQLLSLAAELDTWDPQRIQEPDHVRRHEAYGKLIEVEFANSMRRMQLRVFRSMNQQPLSKWIC